MLTGIGLRNFKAFGNEMQEAPLSKITLIYGPNSGGKSSIIQALLLLKQSLRNTYYGQERNVQVLMPRGEFADLGSFHALIHKHEEKRKLGITLRYKNSEPSGESAENSVEMTFSDVSGSGRLSETRYRIITPEKGEPLLDAKINDAQQGVLSELRILGASLETYVDLHRPMYSRRFLPTLSMPELSEMRHQAIGQIGQARSRMALQRARRQAESQQRRWAPETAEQLELATTILDQLNLSSEQITSLTPENIPIDFEILLDSLNYLGPLRSAPERLYRLSNVDDETTGVKGELSANVLHNKSAVEEQVNRWFKKFGIPYELRVVKLGEASLAGEHITVALYLLDETGEQIKDCKGKRVAVTIADVGYGINQILPVIIEGIASREQSIICVEQPEIHLHPRLQANIADLMIHSIAEERGRRKQWIVETHSELLILRLQRRVREGKISPNDISVLYVDPNHKAIKGSTIEVLRLGEDSYFKDPWPDGFFADALNEELQPDEHSNSNEGADVLDELFSE